MMTTEPKTWGPNENLSLTDVEMQQCRPTHYANGTKARAFCPFHGSDHQRSLEINLETGRFHCFSCKAWGYLADHRQQRAGQTPTERTAPALPRFTPPKQPQPVRDDLPDLLDKYQRALPGSLGERFLRWRGIPLELAQQYGAGYAAPGTWPNPNRDWRLGRVVFPMTTPDGTLISFYGRAVGDHRVPKGDRHDKLVGDAAWFNAAAVRQGDGPLCITEGIFDALSMIVAGHTRTVALIGVSGWRWDWLSDVPDLLLALDADDTGQQEWRKQARQAVLRGKQVVYLAPEAYGDCKDVNEALVAGVLRIGEWPTPPAEPEPPTLDAPNPFGCAVCGSIDVEWVSPATGRGYCGSHYRRE